MINPNLPRILIDYEHVSRTFGPLDFREFVALWYAADALMQAGIHAGFAPEDVQNLLIGEEVSGPLVDGDDCD